MASLQLHCIDSPRKREPFQSHAWIKGTDGDAWIKGTDGDISFESLRSSILDSANFLHHKQELSYADIR
jgi:hypothetical protein